MFTKKERKLIFMQIKKAIILSAGFGKRLNPITLSIPKPLLKINSVTLLENTIKILENFGINEILINTHYLSHQINNFIKNKNFNCKISLIHEDKKILDTGGGVLNITKKFNDDPFFVFNPDTVWLNDHLKDFESMEKLYFENKLKAILLVVDKQNSFDKTLKGDFNLNENIIYRNNVEKNYIYTGSQILDNSVFIDKTIKPFSINSVWDFLINKKKLLGIESKNKFFHITNLEIYNQLIKTGLKFN